MNENDVNRVSAMLKSISHPLRLKILCELQDGEKSGAELQAVVQTSNANVSQHLSILRNQGAVAFRKEANYVYSRIGDPRVNELMATLQALFCGDSKGENHESR